MVHCLELLGMSEFLECLLASPKPVENELPTTVLRFERFERSLHENAPQSEVQLMILFACSEECGEVLFFPTFLLSCVFD